MRRIRRTLAVLFAAAAALLAFVAPAAAQDDRSYRFAEVAIEAELRTDGSLAVVEQRTFAYDGTYRGAFYELPLDGDQRVEQFSLSDSTGVTYRAASGGEAPGTYVDESDGDFSVTWYYATPATDEQRTFTLSYVVRGAGQRHADSAELYWQWIGTGWDVPTDRLVAEVTLPSAGDPLVAGENLLIWAHGPLQGTVEQVAPDTVRTAVDGVPAGSFVELRALLPAEALTDVASDGRAVRAAVLAEENCLGDQADARRDGGRAGSPRDCRPGAGRWRAIGAGVLGAVAAAWGASLAWKLRATHPARGSAALETVPPVAPASGAAWRDTPEPPALVAWLTAGNRTRPNGFVATVLELAQTERLALVPAGPDGDGLLLRDVAPAADPFGLHVQRLLGMAAEGAPELSEADLRFWIDSHPSETAAWWQQWKGLLDRAGEERGWQTGAGWRIATRVLAGPVLVVSWFTLLFSPPLGGAGVLLAIGMLVASFLVGRRSRSAATLAARWRAFGAYLQQTSGGAGGAVDPERWGAWLPYATALGIAGAVARNLEARLAPAELALVGGAYGYGPGLMYPPLWHLHAVGRLPVDRIRAAAMPSSSSSGGGGGFSGGGGGGGGGSGGGAF